MLYRSHQARIRPTETAILFELYPKRDGGYVACVYGFIRIVYTREYIYVGKWILNCKSCDEINSVRLCNSQDCNCQSQGGVRILVPSRDLDTVHDSISLNLHYEGKENLEWAFVLTDFLLFFWKFNCDRYSFFF